MTTFVTTPFGSLEGIRQAGVIRFSGVPFAQKPLGELRFRAPRMVEPWEGTLSATRFAKDPMQKYHQLGPEHFSEDCLYLNIWVPETEEERRPVMVWVPGGAFATGGSGAMDPEGPSIYDGHQMAKDSGCVFVTISYRLNVFGFLNLSQFSPRFDDHIGLKDIVMALRWVHEAISSFGGDPENVTLVGESAGGEAISAMMLVDEAQPYFQKVIIESNCFGSFYTPEEEREICKCYLEYAGLREDEAEKLLNLPYDQLMEAGRKLDVYVAEHYTGRCSFCPVVDGKFLRDFPTLADFSGWDKPVLVGSNRSEGNFQAAYSWRDGEKYAPLVLRRLPEARRSALLAQYPSMREQAAFGKLLTDVMYAFPKLRFAEHLSRGKSQVYVYRFDYYTAALESLGLYACHIAELLALFEFPSGPYQPMLAGSEEEIHPIGVRMRRYWGAFARTGKPAVEGQAEWKMYTEKERNTLVIDRTDRLETDPEVEIRIRYEGLDRVLI